MIPGQNAALMPTVASGRASDGPVTDRLSTLPPGTRVGRYEIAAVLGQGGFGITYRARDTQLGREVALKEYLPISCAVRQRDATVLPRSTQTIESFRWGLERFRAEATTLARLEAVRGVVGVHDYIEANGTAYMVMTLVKGETLEALLQREPRLSSAMLERWLPPLLDGLERVHAQGFLHRDIKPANILIDAQGLPTLIDFGTARLALQDHTQVMTAVYTPGYAPMEQASAAHQGPWTDIYALGATLYRAIAGTPPLNAKDRAVNDALVPAARIGAGQYPPALLAAIDAALVVYPQQRPQTIADWRRMLGTHGVSSDSVRAASPPSMTGRTGSTTANWLVSPADIHSINAPPPPPVMPVPSMQPAVAYVPPLPPSVAARPARGGPPLWLAVSSIGVLSACLVAMVGYMAWDSWQGTHRDVPQPTQQATAPSPPTTRSTTPSPTTPAVAPSTPGPSSPGASPSTPPPPPGSEPYSAGSGNPAITNESVRRAIDETARRRAAEINKQGGIWTGELKQICSPARQSPLIEIVVACTTLIKLNRDDPLNMAVIYANRAQAYRELGEPRAAIRDLDAAIERDQKNAEMVAARGYIYFEMKQYDRAIVDFDAALRLDPRNLNALLGRGNTNADRGRVDLAMQDYNLATQHNPTAPEPFFNRGKIYFMQRNYDGTVSEMTQAIRLNPARSEYFGVRGGAYAMKKEYQRALADLDQAIRLDPGEADYFFNRSGVKLRMGDKAGADADMARAKALNPTIQ
ncbi:tetratricopeptide repeat protein [Reyranella sp. CPCC 100927]|nr:tetratricopeptide repeat protein [Reyranella sp. CPCC 100927]